MFWIKTNESPVVKQTTHRTHVYLGVLSETGEENFGARYHRIALPSPIITVSRDGNFALAFTESFQFEVNFHGRIEYAGFFDAEKDGRLLFAHAVNLSNHHIQGRQTLTFPALNLMLETPCQTFLPRLTSAYSEKKGLSLFY